MIDTMPAWFWIPAALALWAWLLFDVITRGVRRMSALIAQAFADWRECRTDYDLALYAAYEVAAAATNDRLVNARGRAAGIDPMSLFMGNDRRARAYASPELLEHWEAHPRLTFAAFEAQWMASGLAAIDPDGMPLERAQDPRSYHEERDQARDYEAQEPSRDIENQTRREYAHIHEGIER